MLHVNILEIVYSVTMNKKNPTLLVIVSESELKMYMIFSFDLLGFFQLPNPNC